MCPSNLTWSRPYDPPIISIETGHEQARFRYSPDFSQCPNPRDFWGRVSIVMTGSRAADFRACNIEAGLAGTPQGYTWHHKYMVPYTPDNRCEMQLVRTDYHRKTCCHVGGFGQYVSQEDILQMIASQNRADEGTCEYLFRQAQLVAVSQNEMAAPPLATSDVERLSESLALSLPADLQLFYHDGHKLRPDTSFLSAAGCTYLISSVYPLVKSNDATETLQAIVEDERQRAGGPLLFARDGAVPIADDPFGNIYFLAPDESLVYFYDHEQDMAFCTHVPVKEFLDSLYSEEV